MCMHRNIYVPTGVFTIPTVVPLEIRHIRFGNFSHESVKDRKTFIAPNEDHRDRGRKDDRFRNRAR